MKNFIFRNEYQLKEKGLPHLRSDDPIEKQRELRTETGNESLSSLMGKTALIIDDEEDICLLISGFLRKKKIDVEYSVTLAEGLKKIQKLNPYIIFLDNNLPDGSGIDAIEKIRAFNKNIKIIIISALTNLRSKAMNYSADEFIGKPISFQAILDVL